MLKLTPKVRMLSSFSFPLPLSIRALFLPWSKSEAVYQAFTLWPQVFPITREWSGLNNQAYDGAIMSQEARVTSQDFGIHATVPECRYLAERRGYTLIANLYEGFGCGA